MTIEQVTESQRLLAQAINALASTITDGQGMVFTLVAFADLPSASAVPGAVRAVNDSNTNTWGAMIAGSGTFRVLAWSNGTHWTVIGK